MDDLAVGAATVLALTANQIDGADAAANVQPDGGLGVPIRLVGIATVPFGKTTRVDASDAPLCIRDNSHPIRKIDGGFADAAMHVDRIVGVRMAPEVESQRADSHLDLNASQVQAAQVQTTLAGSEIDFQVQRFLVVKLDIPKVLSVVRMVNPGRLGNDEISAKAAGVVADFGPKHGPRIGELAIHQLRRAAADA